MAQAFVSTYKNHYRWNCQPRIPLYDPNKLTKLEPEGDIWLLDMNGEIEEELTNLSKNKEAIYNQYVKRMRSTYQVSYCDNVKLLKKCSDTELGGVVTHKKESEHDLENELLEYCKKLYGVKKNKIIPPLSSARNVFGYVRPTKLLTPLTVYQNEYGRVGFDILKVGTE